MWKNIMNRRNLLKSLVASTLVTAIPGISGSLFNTAAATSKTYPWKNWSGSQQCFPANRAAPRTTTELQSFIKNSTGSVRAVGAGHSFSALVPTNETILSLRRLSGLKSIDTSSKTATFYAGTLLSEMGPILAEHDQALVNMPDIDQQTLAGAVSTATHGTGESLGSLSSYVAGIELVTASGELLKCSETENEDLFKAAQVGLGSLGIMTSVTLKNQSPFKLKRLAQWMSFEDVTAEAAKLAKENRNFEFFYFPFTEMALTDQLNISHAPVSKTEELDGNSGIMDLKSARDYLSWSAKLRELILGSYMRSIGPQTTVDHSYAIYANERNVRFNEMEYHLPTEYGIKALNEIKSLIERKFPEAFFPIECRYIKSEDAWLSPFYQRGSISIAVHRYYEEDFLKMFKAIEPILQKYQGRPHWGKINTFSKEQLKQTYPKWQDFLEIRAEYDPEGKFLNPYLSSILT
jgi:FAD-linked oxidoreductase